MFYTYILYNDDRPFYVGYGTNDRMYQHLQNAKKGCIGRLYGYIRNKFVLTGNEIRYIKIEFQSKEKAIQKEKQLIKEYGRIGIDVDGLLMNITEGGHGGRNTITSKERSKISSKVWTKKKTNKDEIEKMNIKIKMTKMETGSWGNKSTKAKQWNKSSKNHKRLQSYNDNKKIAIYQMDVNGNLLKIWDSMLEASKNLNIGQGSISNACSGRSKTAGNFTWKKVHLAPTPDHSSNA